MNIAPNPRIILAGSVNSSLKTFGKLIEHRCNLVGVLALDPAKSKNVSGYVDLKPHAEQAGVDSIHFGKISESQVEDFVRQKEPDLLFVIGLSQLVREPLLSMAKVGNVGFHPTRLPEGRGRGAVAWMILGKAPGAATFFLMDEGMDSGPILEQKEYEVTSDDYAQDVIDKIKSSIGEVLDDFLPKLNAGEIVPQPQDHGKATYLGKRAPQDGLIDWNRQAGDIHRLIRATSNPLPGAYSFYKGKKVIISRAELEQKNTHIGVPGRILEVKEDKLLVACGEDSSIWLTAMEAEEDLNFRVGQDFGKD